MEQIENKLQELKAALAKTVEDVDAEQLSLADVDKVIELCHNHVWNELKWQERHNTIMDLKLKYVGNLTRVPNKIKAILHWKLDTKKVFSDPNISPNLRELFVYHKRMIIESIKNDDSVTDAYYWGNGDMLLRLINEGVIDVNEDIALLSDSFFKYAAKNTQRLCCQHPKQEKQQTSALDTDEESMLFEYDENNGNKMVMSNLEAFWVAVLANKGADTVDVSYLRALAMSANPRLYYCPMRMTVLEAREGDGGVDLLEKIIGHYNSGNIAISPIVEKRRTLGICVNNSKFEFYDWGAFMEAYRPTGGFYVSKSVSVEMPYMCYLTEVSKVVIEIDNINAMNRMIEVLDPTENTIKESTKKPFVVCDMGKDYLQVGYADAGKIKPYPMYGEPPASYVIEGTVKEHQHPAYYLSLYIGWTMLKIRSIKVYGKAVTFV